MNAQKGKKMPRPNNKKLLILFLWLSILFVIFITPSQSNSQDYMTIVDWPTLIDTPSFNNNATLRLVNGYYGINHPTHYVAIENSLEVRRKTRRIDATFLPNVMNTTIGITKQLKLGILPIFIVGLGDGVVLNGDVWLSLKYVNIHECFTLRAATKIPYMNTKSEAKQMDFDFSVLWVGNKSAIKPEIIAGYRFRKALKLNTEKDYFDYGDPGDEFHLKAGLNFPTTKTSRLGTFIIGYYAQNRISYSYSYSLGSQKTMYRNPYRISAGIMLTKYFKKSAFFGDDRWINLAIIKAIDWRNEMGGWLIITSTNGKLFFLK